MSTWSHDVLFCREQKYFFSGSIIDLQCYVSSRCIAKCFSYAYIYIYFFFFLRFSSLAAKSLQSCPTLRDPIDGSPPGSPIPGILQARTLESKVAQSRPSLSDPVDCSLPGSSVHGIFQAGVLEWVPLPSLKGY